MMPPTIPEQYIVRDLRGALTQRLFPTVTVWNRLEGRPRRADFSRALKAEVRDALWMLTKQWQVGEFHADDAGSPIFAKVRMRTSPVTQYQPVGGPAVPMPPTVPLEAEAEQRGIRWTWNDQKMHLDLRAQVGRQWRRLLEDAGLPLYSPKYQAQYPIRLPALDRAGDYIYAHRTGWQQYAALSGRAIDGGDLHEYLTSNPAHRASDGIVLDAAGDKATLDAFGAELIAWFAKQYLQPSEEAAWKPEYLEYQFACSAPQNGTDVALSADEYAQGHIDWYSFDRSATPLQSGGNGTAAPADTVTTSPFIPTPVTFEGMPDPRWWSLEDRKTDFGSVAPTTTDLAQLLLMEFALVYANDWFLIPFRIPAGTLARIEGMAVTTNFGERLWILPAGTGSEDNWHRWSMFHVAASTPGDGTPDNGLLIPPSMPYILDGDAIEEVELSRDEVANMAWGIELTVPTVTGRGRPGKDEARETLAFQQQQIGAAALPATPFRAPITYRAMRTVPESWIPLIPVHVPGSVREIQLQRSRMLRIVEGDPLPPQKVPPRTTLMRQGLDQTPKQPYFLHEEEVPRAGATVWQSFRRTRWTKGEACVWLGAQKTVGKGERLSSLAFDSIERTPAQQD